MDQKPKNLSSDTRYLDVNKVKERVIKTLAKKQLQSKGIHLIFIYLFTWGK